MSRWPYAGDLPVDRARQVCAEYRRVLRLVAPEACAVLDSAACAAGETWVVDEAAIETADDLVTVARAAELVGRSIRWVYAWVARDPARRRGGVRIMVRLGDVQQAVAHERNRRASRAQS